MATFDVCEPWSVYPGWKSTSLALPDYYSNYIAYSYDTSAYPGIGLRISGEFPRARYISFNLYATKQGTSLKALTDFQIRTPNPEENPFVAGNPAGNRQYVVRVQPEQGGTDAGQQTEPRPAAFENVLNFDPSELEGGLLTVVLRYYVPEPYEFGGVPCPTITGYRADDPDGGPLDAPDAYPVDMGQNEPVFRYRLSKIFDTARGEALRFYHAAGQGQFNNADNIYLISAVKDVVPGRDAVILRVGPPAYPNSTEEYDRTPVRYWSFNQGNPDTSTPFGMKDSEFVPATDGFVYIVMGDEGLADRAERGGYNFMPWKADSEKAVIVYRNMLTVPQYRGSIMRVPNLPPARKLPPHWDESVLEEYEASRHIPGYAPSGRKVTEQQFREDFGGMPSPGFAHGRIR